MRAWKLVWVGVLVTAASCVQLLDGDHPYSVAPPVDTDACETAVHCDDGSSCTVNTCSNEKVCIYTPLKDGPNREQTIGDCLRRDCSGGKEVTVADNMDIPDDNEPCTTDVCTAGTPSNTPIPDGGACQRGNQSGTCETGVCQISCDAQNPCNDSNPCTDDSCDIATKSCVFANIDGLPTPDVAQIPGDCKERRCMDGKDVVALEDADPEDDANACTHDVCTGGVTQHTPVATGSACSTPNSPIGMGTCDATGTCLGCVITAHCGLGYTCAQNTCFSCSDGTKDGTETDVDCGGECPARCNIGDACVVTADCEGECDLGICVNCFDTVKNGTEGDVDCGGTCALPCATGETCNMGTDCFNKVCANGTCLAPTCADGTPNGSETDVDCGGSCPDCVTGKKCSVNGDCTNDCVDKICN